MPRKDTYHNLVRDALIRDGWTITHDPLTMTYGTDNVHIDLGAHTILAAEKTEHKIAVEIKSFLNPSKIANREQALGQYRLYRFVLHRHHTVLAFHHPDARKYTPFALA